MQHDKLISESAKIFSAILTEYAGVTGAPHRGQEDPGMKGRLKAWKTMKGEISRAAKEGRPVVNTREGGRGDPVLNKLAKKHAAKVGAKYSEEDLDTSQDEKSWGNPKHVEAMKKGTHEAFPEDDPTGKTKPNPTSRGVKGINRKRRRQWLGKWKQVHKKGGVNVSTVGGGHDPVVQRYFRMARRKNPNAFK